MKNISRRRFFKLGGLAGLFAALNPDMVIEQNAGDTEQAEVEKARRSTASLRIARDSYFANGIINIVDDTVYETISNIDSLSICYDLGEAHLASGLMTFGGSFPEPLIELDVGVKQPWDRRSYDCPVAVEVSCTGADKKSDFILAIDRVTIRRNLLGLTATGVPGSKYSIVTPFKAPTPDCFRG